MSRTPFMRIVDAEGTGPEPGGIYLQIKFQNTDVCIRHWFRYHKDANKTMNEIFEFTNIRKTLELCQLPYLMEEDYNTLKFSIQFDLINRLGIE